MYYVLQDVIGGARCYGLEWEQTQGQAVGVEFTYGSRRVRKLLSTPNFQAAQDLAHSTRRAPRRIDRAAMVILVNLAQRVREARRYVRLAQVHENTEYIEDCRSRESECWNAFQASKDIYFAHRATR